jgi:protein involved in polysaccharide export with SLBB domain
MRNAKLVCLALLVCGWRGAISNEAAEPAAHEPAMVHVTVSGEVHDPGRYEVRANTSVNDLLWLAGGLTAMGGDMVYLSHTDESGRTRRFPIDLRDTREGGPGVLREGDSVEVARANQFSISGEVNMPGTYRLDASMTVLQAIKKAGDVTTFGSYGTVVVQRTGAGGKAQTLKLKPDDFVEPDDVIRVKTKLF